MNLVFPLWACSSPWIPALMAPPPPLLQTSYEMMMQCVSRMLAHPLHGKDTAAKPTTVQEGGYRLGPP